MRSGFFAASRLGAHRGELVLRSCSSDRRAPLSTICVRDLGVAIGARELEDGVAVPIEPEPAHPVEDRVDRRLGRARAVGILDPQQELAAVMAREQPVEQRGARAADMQKAGRRRREPGDDWRGGRAGGRPGSELALNRACSQS